LNFSIYNRIKRYLKRHLFNILFGSSFKKFGKNISIIDADIIEGEKFISLGDDVSLNSKAWLLALKQDSVKPYLVIEDGVTIGRFAHIVAIRDVYIGKNVLIADKVYISDNTHAYQTIDTPILDQEILFKGSVSIGENSWIGENVSIVGSKIGKHCVVGAHSLVNSDIPDYSIAVGSPAKVIKKYSFKEQKWKKYNDK